MGRLDLGWQICGMGRLRNGQGLRCEVCASTASARLKLAKHNEGVDIAERRVKECFRKPTDDLKSERLPESHRAFVAADDEIELHGPEALCASMGERVLMHLAGHARPLAFASSM